MMIKTKKYFLVFSILLAAGTLISQMNFIPTWKVVQATLVVVIFGINILMGLFYLFKSLMNNYRDKQTRTGGWIKSILISLTIIAVATMLFFFSALTMGQGIFGPVLVKEYKFKDIIVYQFEQSCFPPDNLCECKDYNSIVYIKDSLFPIMHLKKKVNFYIGSIRLIDDGLIVRASEECKRDRAKEMVVSLK